MKKNITSQKAQIDIYENKLRLFMILFFKLYYSYPKYTFIEGHEENDKIGGVNWKNKIISNI